MTIHRRLNQYCLGGNHVTWWFIKTLLDAGWTVPASGSGTGGLYATSNVFDTSQLPKQYSLLPANNVGVGSEPWGYPYCWVVLEDPSGNRQLLLQRDNLASDSGDDEWYAGWSFGGRYGEGQTPGTDWDHDTLPVAPDQEDVWGSPAGWVALLNTGGTRSLAHFAADDTPSPEGEYGAICLDINNGNVLGGSMILDDVRDTAAGYPHPIVLYFDFTNYLTVGGIGGQSVARYGRVMIDPGGTNIWQQIGAAFCRWASVNVIPGNGGLGIDNKERAVPAIWGFGGAADYVGTSRWFNWAAITRGYPTTANNRSFIYVSDMVISDLWDGTTVPGTI